MDESRRLGCVDERLQYAIFIILRSGFVYLMSSLKPLLANLMLSGPPWGYRVIDIPNAYQRYQCQTIAREMYIVFEVSEPFRTAPVSYR